MKNIFKPVLAVALFAAMVSITSCEKTCDAGYEGSDCKTLKTAKFIGDWKGQDVCTSNTYTNITITNTTQSDIMNISIKNIGGFGGTEVITGVLSSSTSSEVGFTNQTLSGNRTISGTMTVDGTSMTVSYTVTPAVGAADVCNGTYTKL